MQRVLQNYSFWAKLVPALLTAFLAARVLGAFAQDSSQVYLLVFLAAELITLALIITAKPPEEVRLTGYTALVTFVPCFVLPFIQFSDGAALIPQWLTVCLIMVGAALQIIAKLTLGRSFGLLPARRSLVERGPYAFVRHPIYLAYFTAHLGLLLYSFSLWNATILFVIYACQVARMLQEEKVLSNDPGYVAYTARVQYRAIPGVF